MNSRPQRLPANPRRFRATGTPRPEKPLDATTVTHQTAPTQYVDAAGVKLAYRRFGKPGGVPLVMFQHFVGTMDSWDPMITDGFAREREVILFDNAGVASSQGEVPTSVEGMADHAIALIEALKVKQADLLGFSLGGLVAQQVALQRPDLARRAFLERLRARRTQRDLDVNDKVAPAQIAAFAAWGAPRAGADAYLQQIRQPVLVVSGSRDLVHYTVNSYTLQQRLPNAQLIVYPDSNHGAIYQYPALFLAQASLFLNQR